MSEEKTDTTYRAEARARERQKKAEEAARQVTDLLNPMDFKPSEFIEAMTNEHRTLQQGFTQVCLDWIYHCSQLEPGYYDARNEASRIVCGDIVAACTPDKLWSGATWPVRLPTI